MTSKHTKGPWKVSHQNGDGLPENEGLVGVVGPERTNSRGKKFTLYVAQYIKPENARLIAAAPEMLDSLKLALELDSVSPNCDEVCNTIRKLIERIEGDTE